MGLPLPLLLSLTFSTILSEKVKWRNVMRLIDALSFNANQSHYPESQLELIIETGVQFAVKKGSSVEPEPMGTFDACFSDGFFLDSI